MSRFCTVKQGDHVARIAAQFGFSSPHTIWEDPQNAELKEKRKTPNILLPGDKLFLPDREQRIESKSTDQRHRFVARKSPLLLLVLLKDNEFQPLAGRKCKVEADGSSEELTTDGSGLLTKKIQATAEDGRLTVDNIEVPFKIGHLDPVDEVSGQQARLNNLGYRAGTVGEGGAPEILRSAVEEFQCDQHLTVDGVCGPATQAKLKTVYGCEIDRK